MASLAGSLVTVAAMPHWSPTIMEVGGMKVGVKVTTIGGGVELRLPQAARSMEVARQAKAREILGQSLGLGMALSVRGRV